MTNYLQILGQPDIWLRVRDALGDGFSRYLATRLSERVPDCCLRLSELEQPARIETLGLYQAGQRLAQRTVAWPERDSGTPSILATESEHRFRLRITTDLPNQIDATLNKMAVQQVCVAGKPPVFPIVLVMPGAEKSWEQLPGFQPVLTMMFGSSVAPRMLEESKARIRLPEPQSMILVEAIHRPGATVFELELLSFGVPMRFVLDDFNRRLGRYGRACLNPVSGRPTIHIEGRGYFVASLGLSLAVNMSRGEGFDLLYNLASQMDAVLNWPGDPDDPDAWSDLSDSRLVPLPAKIDSATGWMAISRRVPLSCLQSAHELVGVVQPALQVLPTGVVLEIAYPGPTPWHQQFCGSK